MNLKNLLANEFELSQDTNIRHILYLYRYGEITAQKKHKNEKNAEMVNHSTVTDFARFLGMSTWIV